MVSFVCTYVILTYLLGDLEQFKKSENIFTISFKICYSNETITRIMSLKEVSKNRAETIAMSSLEYDEEKHMRNEREEGREKA